MRKPIPPIKIEPAISWRLEHNSFQARIGAILKVYVS